MLTHREAPHAGPQGSGRARAAAAQGLGVRPQGHSPGAVLPTEEEEEEGGWECPPEAVGAHRLGMQPQASAPPARLSRWVEREREGDRARGWGNDKGRESPTSSLG